MYKKDRYTIICKHCGNKHKVGDNRIQYCSIACYNTHTKTKGIDGYKKCEVCDVEFPYRKTLLVRNCGVVHCVRSRFCSKKCSTYWRSVLNNPSKNPETARKISQAKKNSQPTHLWTDDAIQKRRITISGDGHWNWQGGKTDENKKRRKSYETRQWRKAVFDRDNYTCVLCKRRSCAEDHVYLQADHIKPWSTHPDLRWDIDNGRTLCVECHRETDTYGVKATKKMI